MIPSYNSPHSEKSSECITTPLITSGKWNLVTWFDDEKWAINE